MRAQTPARGSTRVCTGLEGALIPLVLGAGTSAVGGAITSAQQNANATNQANAENAVLTDTLAKNAPLAADATSKFNVDLAGMQPGATAATQAGDTATRLNAIVGNMPTITPSTMPGAADAPTIVKNAISQSLAEALAKSKATATAQATLGGYGDLFLGQGLADQNTKEGIDSDISRANSNNALITPLQQIAANGAYTPISPIGGILQSAGTTLGAAAGAGKITNATFGVT
jgi:hypothetical protein